MPTVSVIIPTYNRAALLPAAIDSARNAGQDTEVIVVDDGSTDGTGEVCQRLSGFRYIRYIRLSANQGLAAARNAGVLASSAQFVAFLDDDDLRLPGSLDAQVNALRESPNAAFCYGRGFVIDADRRRPTGEIFPPHCPTGDIFWDLLEQNFVPVVSVVARRQIVAERGLFTVNLDRAEDWDLWLRIAELWPVAAVEAPVVMLRRANLTSGQMCSDSVSIYQQMLRIQNMALRRPRARAAPRAKRRRARLSLVKLIYDALLHEAQQALAEGNREVARAKTREALRVRPLRARADLKLLRLRWSA